MRAFGNFDTGAARPPRCFRWGLALVAGLVALASVAQAEEAKPDAEPDPGGCRYVRYGPMQIEGFEGTDPFGFQLIAKDSNWVFGPARLGVTAFCPYCPPSDVSKGVMAIGRSPFLPPVQEGALRGETGQESASRMEFALHPRAIAVSLWRITSLLPEKVEPVGDVQPITLWDVPGLARVVSVTSVGRVAPGIAVALEDHCFSLFAVFFRKDERQVDIDDVLAIDSSLGVLKYQPERHKLSPSIDFPLGDARKKWEEDQK